MDRYVICSYCTTRDEFNSDLSDLVERFINSKNDPEDYTPLEEGELYDLACMLEANCSFDTENWDIIIKEKDKYDYFEDDFDYITRNVDSRIAINKEETIDNIIDDSGYWHNETIMGETYLVREDSY